jgi:hypothetical protein
VRSRREPVVCRTLNKPTCRASVCKSNDYARNRTEKYRAKPSDNSNLSWGPVLIHGRYCIVSAMGLKPSPSRHSLFWQGFFGQLRVAAVLGGPRAAESCRLGNPVAIARDSGWKWDVSSACSYWRTFCQNFSWIWGRRFGIFPGVHLAAGGFLSGLAELVDADFLVDVVKVSRILRHTSASTTFRCAAAHLDSGDATTRN